ncbi:MULTISPECIES: DMT family transporter [Sphingopyxis]|uniref:DMT family transporter n=1 Tax=Sphingopyxis TaxID=165697 RepID=UPI00086B62DE|nr:MULTISPECIES: SMR family transporter [Sphingopyxis]APW73182.1 hypothetical protein BWD40_10450 [Sphingopyxis granuli]AVA14202.1 small multi-drug resistant family protein [Sphingopyxis sp. MG]ODU28682.1 MAG: hypothetical protein ABS88_11850 [Sphingopyxis sp. SCN 67-31]
MNATLSPPLLLLILTSVGMSALAQMLLKLGVQGARATRTLSETMLAYASSPYLIAGFALYGLGAVLWLFVLARLPLSVAYPFVGLGFIFTMLIGAMAFHEHLSLTRIAGTLLIALGCVLVAQSAGGS